ncbi:MAG TPA: hypothetical protein VMF91_01725 [Bryobacteraceae bacterium]|nr:hypothetical protein [Bryobacteraceae bacterium]
MLRHNDAGWSNPKVLTILAVIFVCGAALGSAVTSRFLHARSPMLDHRAAMESAERLGVQHLKTELALTPEQNDTVMKVLDDYGKYYQNIEDEREDVAEHGKQRILGVLDAKQKKRFLELLKDPSLFPNSPLQ